VHRIGRTGRAGLTGEAISLVASDDLESFAAIEKLIKKQIERVIIPGFEPDAAVLSSMLGREGARAGSHDSAPRGGRGLRRESAAESRSRPTAPVARPAPREQARKPADPIFSQPYEPGQLPVPDRPAPPPRRRERPVAALLGGFKPAKP
jgi:ATP-dependent RNA helicase RhlE